MSKYINISRDKMFSPALEAKFITLATPYYFKPDDPRDKGSYSVTLRTTDSDWLNELEIMSEEMIEEYCNESGNKRNKMTIRNNIYPRVDEVDEDDDPTGMVLVKFNSKAKGENSKNGRTWEVKIPVVDAQAHPLTDDQIASLGSGSNLRVCYVPRVFNMGGVVGISFNLRSVQVVEPVWRTSSTADFVGQEVEGFTVEEAAVGATEDSDF